MKKYLAGSLLGGAFGYFILYRVIGCATGTCAITANPYTATFYGVVIGLLIANMFSSSSKKAKAAYIRISAEEAREKMQEQAETIILDVRSKAEYNAGHLPGAVLLPGLLIKSKAPSLLPDKSAQILVYCQTGHRSASAARKLLGLGYENVFDFGGIRNWPGELVTSPDEPF